MRPTTDDAKQLHADRLVRAIAATGEEKLLAGPRLFALACNVVRDGIRDQHPEFHAGEVEAELRRRVALMP